MSPHENTGTSALSVLLLGAREVVRERLVRLLAAADDLVVREADSLPAALVALLATRIDVVALDVEGGGLDLLPRVRALVAEAVVIALGADAEPELAERCRALGAASYFVIPRDSGLLRELLVAMARGR